MNTKYLMISSAILTGVLGLTASFLPNEILKQIAGTDNEVATLLVQITGALYLGFAMLNWMARTLLIGGIYAKPLSLGNFLHFTVAAIALFKFATSHSSANVWLATTAYAGFAILFGWVVFISPKQVVVNNNDLCF